MLPMLKEIRAAANCHVATLPVPYRATPGHPSFLSRTAPCSRTQRQLPVALHHLLCTRGDNLVFRREAQEVRVRCLGPAYYLAKNHRIRNVAVLERGWLGGGNTGRNTTIVRSNYLYPESARLYDFALKLYERLSRELNFNIMLSQRGLIDLAHSRHDLDSMVRWVNAMHMNGVDAELLSRDEVAEWLPLLDMSPDARYPVLGGFLQRRAGTARHDAVAWGYARAADALGVDIIQNCEVTGFRTGADGRVVGGETSRGRIQAEP